MVREFKLTGTMISVSLILALPCAAAGKTEQNVEPATKQKASRAKAVKPDTASPKTDQGTQAPTASPVPEPKSGQASTPTPDPKSAQTEPKAEPPGWSKPEIEAALARCKAQLQGLPVVTVPVDAIKDGNCGAPAPVKLISLGTNPQVVLNPPPTVTCDLVVALHQWIKDGVQPLAKKHFGAPVSRIDTMSDYSCRVAYGRRHGRLSEHAHANALDIRGFITTVGETTAVKDAWGMTARDVRAQVAAAERAKQKAAAAKAEAEKAVAANQVAPAGKSSAQKPLHTETAANRQAPPAPAEVKPSVEALAAVRIPAPDLIGSLAPQDDDKPLRSFSGFFGRSQKPDATTLSLSKLGGPKEADGKKPSGAESKAMFLREVHAHGCTIFGTTLGPESNEAHRDHLHVDMAERRVRKICE